jgi:uncharacterized DUF497 family protein
MDSFDWDPHKDVINQLKHGVSFYEAQFAFSDPLRVTQKTYRIAANTNVGFTVLAAPTQVF